MSEPQDTTILVVDDEPANLTSLAKIFAKENFRVLKAPDGKKALEICRNHRVQVVLTDLMMPVVSGIDLVKALRTVQPDAEVVVMTAYGTIETAVEAMREGAFDFVEKPLKRMQILKTVRQAVDRHSLVTENKTLKRELSALKQRSIVGSSPALRRALDIAQTAAPSTATVLILGESGTGKELLARFLHEQSKRRGAFVGVNLAALPETLVESELFGHERGSFTGANQKRQGRIANAKGGTLFLDEIGELAPQIQVKLLRVLQEGEYEPVGGQTERADFRLVAATNRDLQAAVEMGDFREDLYYRLNVIAVTSPPLRDRQGDMPLLIDHFLGVYGSKNNKGGMFFDAAALERMMAYDWPGNVRELENVVERAVVLGKSAEITVAQLPEVIARAERVGDTLSFEIGTPLDDIERRVLHATLNHTKGDKQLAAQLLGISARTIYRKLGAERP